MFQDGARHILLRLAHTRHTRRIKCSLHVEFRLVLYSASVSYGIHTPRSRRPINLPISRVEV